MLKRILIAALMLPLVALAQSYPSPTFNNVTVQGTLTAATPAFTNPVPVASGGTGATTAATARTNLGAASTGANTFTASQTVGAAAPLFVLNDTSGSGQLGFFYQSSGASVWATLVGTGARNWLLQRYVSGVVVDNPISVLNSTGQAVFTVRPTFNGATPWDSANLASPASTASPAFTGTPTAPTATTGTNTTQIATTAFAQNAVTGGSNAGSFTTLASSGLFTPTGGIAGITNGSAAAVGAVGESMTAAGSAISLTTSVVANCTSVTLTAGDWDVWGYVFFVPASGAAITNMQASTSTTSATLAAVPDQAQLAYTGMTNFGQSLQAPMRIFNVTTSTQVFTVATASFSAGTVTMSCRMFARRRH